ncbi:tetratricopeptide repeat protein [Candidatus Thioglobus sp.]|uniref:tetratricopeptide repeat protein n=1 Tax=Candidatus Thioglobus sp. TaxID=2026721 RepID=UPI00262FEF2E|nr:tetratricopeptide repeat protein [Candidatus Thioglobus sp.]MDG2395894.1 tetratricopeptide repeat protein [Candidatus Thioglobus sp.]
MKRFAWMIFLGVFAWQPASAGINIDKVIIDHNKKIKRLVRKNKSLKGKIEKLEQQQQESSKKISELFNLMEYKKSSAVVEQTMKRVREHNKKAKKIYTNARSLLVTDQYDQAVVLFKQYLDIYPENNHAPDAHYWLAKTYLAKGDYQLAKNAFVTFQQANPLHHKYSNSLFELARVYVELKQTQKAQALINRMLKKFPEHNATNRAKQLLSKITPENLSTNESNKSN